MYCWPYGQQHGGDSMSKEHYDGAGDGQCLAIKASDGERCMNGVYGSNDFCGHHMRASDVTTAIEVSDREWVQCDECGWQKAEWEPAEPPFCSWCGVQVGGDYEVRKGGDQQ